MIISGEIAVNSITHLILESKFGPDLLALKFGPDSLALKFGPDPLALKY